jgi:DNA-binding NtrC family response regulator
MMTERMTEDRATRTLTRPTSAQAAHVYCEVLSGRGVASRHLLGEAPAVAGSDARAEIVIGEDTVSRRHAQLEATQRGVLVRDLGSRNGTWYQGASVSEALVPFGGTVRLGRTLVRFVTGDAGTAGAVAPPLDGLLGTSAAMVALRGQLQRVAATDAAVLLRGETGTGKEVAARAIHAASRRAGGAFVPLDAGPAASGLLDSHLFGHRRGAFTGATSSRVGAIEAAHGGTLFLDEVGELPFELQLRLLRVLETRRFTRLGDATPQASDFRLVGSTQHDLDALVREGRFREDLYFRIMVVVIDVPPLRHREGDIALLAEHFAAERGVTLDGVTLAAWRQREWRGNVRELKNAVARYDAEVLVGSVPAAAPMPRARAREELDQALLSKALEAHGYDVAAAARQVGLSRSQVYRLMQRYGLTAPADRRRGKRR